MDVRFMEVKPINMNEYLEKILELQDEVFKDLEKHDKQHLFFRSSKEEIKEYIESENAFVGILKMEGTVISACHFSFNHSVYNDLILYIKNSSVYREFILSHYNKSILTETYIFNLCMYSILKNQDLLNYKLLYSIYKKVENNDFFETDPLRQSTTKLLVNCGILKDPIYPWIKSTDLPGFKPKFSTLAKEYDKFISYFEYKYVITPKGLNPSLVNLTNHQVIELGSYFSSLNYRNKGCASALIKWSIEKIMSQRNIRAIYATVHPDNTVSHHILYNLGFTHFCTVERQKNVFNDIMIKVLD